MCLIYFVAMYSPTFIDEVYAKATDEAANTVREYKHQLEAFFNVTLLRNTLQFLNRL